MSGINGNLPNLGGLNYNQKIQKKKDEGEVKKEEKPVVDEKKPGEQKSDEKKPVLNLDKDPNAIYGEALLVKKPQVNKENGKESPQVDDSQREEPEGNEKSLHIYWESYIDENGFESERIVRLVCKDDGDDSIYNHYN